MEREQKTKLLEGEMKRIGKGKEWDKRTTDQYGNTEIWHYKAVTRMGQFRFGRPTWSEDEEPYLCWNRQRYYLSEFLTPKAGSPGLSLFAGVSPLSYSAGVGICLGDNEEGQLNFHV